VEFRVTTDKRLRENSSRRVDQDIAESGLAHGRKRLMPFIEAGVAHSNQQRKPSPHGPPAISLRSNAVKDDDTEVGEFRDAGRFSNSEMQRFSLSGVAGKSNFRVGMMMRPVYSRNIS
jgi:hypothetical protein